MTRSRVFANSFCRRSLFAGGAAAMLLPGFGVESALADGTLKPSAALPGFGSVSADDYFILLLAWSQDVTIGPVTARITYLDPSLYLAWLKQTNPDVTQAIFTQAMAGFPNILRFRVSYRAATRNLVKATSWRLTFDDGSASQSEMGRQLVAPVSLQADANGEYWEEIWDYQFHIANGTTPFSNKGFAITLSGPMGSGQASWAFDAVPKAAENPDAYVPYLGTALSIISALLAVGLFYTRPPKRSVQ